MKMSFFAYMGGFDVKKSTFRTGMELMTEVGKLKPSGDTEVSGSATPLDFNQIEGDIEGKSITREDEAAVPESITALNFDIIEDDINDKSKIYYACGDR